MVVDFYTAGVFICFLALVYLSFFWKVNWIQDLTIQDTKSMKYRIRKSREIGRLPPVYPNGWFGILESLALKKGQVEHVSALGQNLAVFRSESGAIRIINAYCPHLGANMAVGGVVKGEELECPFHSWRFCGETGKCTSIPYSKKGLGSVNAKVWVSFEANGVIFFWYHAESAPPSWYPEPIKQISDGTWRFQGRNEFYMNCHIQEIPENGADQAHLSSLHGPPIILGDSLSKIVHHSWTNAAWSTSFNSETDLHENNPGKNQTLKQGKTNNHVATSRLCHSVMLFERFSILGLDVVASQIGPGYVELYLESVFGTMCIIQTVTPLQPLLQRVTHLIFAPFWIAPYSKIVMLGECLMFDRDARVWNNKKYLENPNLVSEERTIKAFRRWYKQFYSKNSPTYESCKNSLEW